jgi:selenide,water dikinase
MNLEGGVTHLCEEFCAIARQLLRHCRDERLFPQPGRCVLNVYEGESPRCFAPIMSRQIDIVLLGGGHAHVQVLVALARRPVPGVQVTLISRDAKALYSGMLPGVVAGLYAPEKAQIDLVRLAAATGARFVHAEAVGIDRSNKRVILAAAPTVGYDILSIDVGIAPALAAIAGVERALAVKPIGSFLPRFGELIARCRRPDDPKRIAVIGGGAGGVELLLSIRTRLMAETQAALSFALVTDGEILATHNSRVRAAFRRIFAERGIALHEHRRARAVTMRAIELEGGETIAADAVLIATDAAAPDWFRETGLALDPHGFLAIGPTLQATNDPDVFAAGDCAALIETPHEKSGVYAVRAGPPLADNLRRRSLGEPLEAWRPQRRHLALISTGERYAVASRGMFKMEGAWVWTLKDWIDRRWVRQYRDVAPIERRRPGAK